MEDSEKRYEAYRAFKALTPAQVQELIEFPYHPWANDSDWADETIEGEDVWSHLSEEGSSREVEDLGKVTVVLSVGGSEGGGETAYQIVRVDGPNYGSRHFRIDGWYQSYDGAHYDGDLFEVEPRHETVIVYVPVVAK